MSVDLQIQDYDNLLDSVKNLVKEKQEDSDEIKLLDWINKLIPDKAKIFDGLEIIINIKDVKEKLSNIIEKNVLSKIGMDSAEINELSYTKNENGILSVSIGISEYDYAEIFEFISKKLNNKEEKVILKIADTTLDIVREVLSDDLKDELITKVINASSENICELATNEINKKSDMGISLSNLHCKSGY